jgi:hypothetical protein
MLMKFAILVWTQILWISFCQMIGNGQNFKIQENYMQCEICIRMFQYEFDFDKLLKDENKIKEIRMLNKNNDNVEMIAKEIAMQYFFKGADSQFEGKMPNGFNIQICKETQIGMDMACDKVRKSLCEGILSLENGICESSEIEMMKKTYNFNYPMPHTQEVKQLAFNHNFLQPINQIKENEVKSDIFSNNFQNNIQNNQNQELHNFKEQIKVKDNEREKNNLLQNSFQEYLKSLSNTGKGLGQIQQPRFKEQNFNPPLPNNDEAAINSNSNKYTQTSFLNLTPEYISQNFDSQPKTHWRPPTPVLLKNFDMADQLRDISILTT